MACYGSQSGGTAGDFYHTTITYEDCNGFGNYWHDTAANYANYYTPTGDSDAGMTYENGTCGVLIDGTGYALADDPNQCVANGYDVFIRGTTYKAYVNVPADDGSPPDTSDSDPVPLTMEDLFFPQNIPVSDYQMIFTLFFTLPLLVYLVAWGYQSVINFAAKDNY